MTSARSIRSNVVPAGRDHEAEPRPGKPQLQLVAGRRKEGAVAGGFRRVASWTRRRNATMLHIVFAITFLVASLLTSLILTTQMVQNSFTASKVKENISQLSQDVDDDQAKLDDLEASLPQKAKDMGMVPQQGAISIDLSGYANSGGKS